MAVETFYYRDIVLIVLPVRPLNGILTACESKPERAIHLGPQIPQRRDARVDMRLAGGPGGEPTIPGPAALPVQ